MSHLSTLLEFQAQQHWVRPSDWLPMPVARADQRRSLLALVAVFPRPTSLGFVGTGAAYTVDWGDGLVQTYQSGEHASHVYTYAKLPASSQCARGYRQAIVRVSWSAGHNDKAMVGAQPTDLTALEVTDYTAVNDLNKTSTPLLDIQLAGLSLASLVLSPALKPSRMVEQVWMRPLAGRFERWSAYSQGLFENMNALQSVPEFDLGKLTNMDRAFRNCTSLVVPPDFDASLVTSMQEIFAGCTAMISLGMSIPACTNVARAFQGCTALKEVCLQNSHQVANWQDAFKGCTSLVDVDVDDFSGATDLSATFEGCLTLETMHAIAAPLCLTTDNMFRGCIALQSLGDLTMPQNLNIIGMFQGCWQMRELPLLDFGQLLYVSGAFAEMYALETPPRGFDTAECLEFSSMFANCVNLKRLPELSTSQGRSFYAVFQNCTLLEYVPAWDFSGVTNTSGLSQAFENLRSCTRVLAKGFRATFSLRGLPLQGMQVNEVLENLGTLTGNSRTVLLKDVVGALQDNLLTELATSKGWQVAA